MGLPYFAIVAVAVIVVAAIVYQPVKAENADPVFNKDVDSPSIVTPADQPMISVDVPQENKTPPKESEKEIPKNPPDKSPSTANSGTGTEADWQDAPGEANGQPSAPPPTSAPATPALPPQPPTPADVSGCPIARRAACTLKDGISKCAGKLHLDEDAHVSFEDGPWAYGSPNGTYQFHNLGSIHIGNRGPSAEIPAGADVDFTVEFPSDSDATDVRLDLRYILTFPSHSWHEEVCTIKGPINRPIK